MVVIKNEKARRFLKIAVPFIFIPVILFLGVFAFDEKKFAWIILAVTIMALLLFFAGFEKKIIGTRRMVIIAVMTALSVLGRFIFAVIPGFKPITAIVVITAVWLGPESGFLTGALSAVISNFYFGQGPWTPFQMFAWGIIGLVAGYLSNILKKNRPALAVYGVFAGIFYSMLMDVWSVLWFNNNFEMSVYLAALVTAIPYTISYAASNVVFLLLLGRPFGEKLERVKLKYGV
ncbi:MAG: ECF transporter S component [Eubacterium sp.]|nr:ECF transporter S component [Eubacterium sp.]